MTYIEDLYDNKSDMLIYHKVSLEDDNLEQHLAMQKLNCKHNLVGTLVVYEL